MYPGVILTFAQLYDRDWHRLGAFSSNDNCGFQGSNELDRRVWQLVMNIGRSIEFKDGFCLFMTVTFDESQYVKLTLFYDDSHWITSTPGFCLPDNCHGTLKQSSVAEPIKGEPKWAFPPRATFL